jgi:hypothetical protein
MGAPRDALSVLEGMTNSISRLKVWTEIVESAQLRFMAATTAQAIADGVNLEAA